jgi:16S rRNA (guanine(966)-N(2))-methyltransferase RsmD
VKGAIFNILANSILEANFLDLYAGTGGVGIEALSRGAKLCVFVEKSRTNAQLIKENLERTKFKGLVLVKDVSSALSLLKRQGYSFNLVFMDPPYEKGLVTETLRKLAIGGCLAKDAIILAEHSIRESVSPVEGFEQVRQYKYGDTILSLFLWKGTQ